MPDPRLLALANECRERAEEILTKAETFNNAHAIERESTASPRAKL
jgi:hypothetical protein